MAQTILITGASSGIGKVTAKLFQERGWNVIATMRKPENEDELTKLNNVLVVHLDVTDEASIHAAVAAGIAKFGQIDALLNNAGYGAYGPLEVFEMDSIRRQFDTNVIGLLAVTKAIIPHMRQNKAGTIVNISSIGGQMTFPFGRAVSRYQVCRRRDFGSCAFRVGTIWREGQNRRTGPDRHQLWRAEL